MPMPLMNVGEMNGTPLLGCWLNTPMHLFLNMGTVAIYIRQVTLKVRLSILIGSKQSALMAK